jgi:DNA (cytosine-5)-methyltransferase 1
MEGQADSVWLHRKQLKGCDALLRAFVRRLRERQCIPFPGEVDFICGGPPCQGISGNNRHALLEDIFNCPRNRQLPVFTAYIRWLRPKYVLMENVTDILKKEDGAYIKYAMGSMLDMRYQVN